MFYCLGSLKFDFGHPVMICYVSVFSGHFFATLRVVVLALFYGDLYCS